MMHKIKKAAAVAALTLFGGAASADIIDVRLEQYGFFPDKIYVQVGDTIRFTNHTWNWARVYSYDSNDNLSGYSYSLPCQANDGQNNFNGELDGWSTGWISQGSSVTVTVSACMETQLLAPYVYNYNYYVNNHQARIIYGEAPNS